MLTLDSWVFFFFKQNTAYEMLSGDWSSDVCSSDLGCRAAPERGLHQRWRAPLRAALDWLATELRAPFERDGKPMPRELECHALRMFTSCGWFFDDIAGIESVIVLRSAARAIELSGPDAPRLEAGLLERLALAPCNDPAVGSGRELYLQRVKR